MEDCLEEEELYELEDQSVSSAYFSTYNGAFLKQLILKKDPKYKDLKKFIFKDIGLFMQWMQCIEERTKIEVTKFN